MNSNFNEMIGASKALGNVVREIKNAWLEAFGVEMIVTAERPRARFDQVLDQLRTKLAETDNRERLLNALDIESFRAGSRDAEQVIKIVADDNILRNVDDLTPNQIIGAIAAVAEELGDEDKEVEIELTDFLRRVIKKVFVENDIKGRINIGPNRHFPRLFQWLTEYAEQTVWEDGTGLKIRNLSGKGRVKRFPQDPKTLKIVINWAFL